MRSSDGCGMAPPVATTGLTLKPTSAAASLRIQQSCSDHSNWFPYSVPGTKYTRSELCLQILSYFIRVTLMSVNIHLSKLRTPVDYEVTKLNLTNKHCLSSTTQLDFPSWWGRSVKTAWVAGDCQQEHSVWEGARHGTTAGALQVTLGIRYPDSI